MLLPHTIGLTNEIYKMEEEFVELKVGNMTHRPTPTETQTKWSSTTKRSGGDWSSSKGKRLKVEEMNICSKCGKAHLGECRFGMDLCYRCGKTGHMSCVYPKAPSSAIYRKRHNCGKPGHFSKECLKPKSVNDDKTKEVVKGRARTRAYALTQEEERGYPNVVSSTFILDHAFISVLFDSCASKSFISSSFCKRLKYKTNVIERAFSVETDVGRSTKVVELVDDLTIKIEGHRFPVRLFVIALGGFNVVLGMDWQAANEARIVCKRKLIQLNASDGSEVMFYGDHDIPLTNVITMMKAEKYMRRGCEAYLTYVIDKDVKVKELKDVPVVCHYPKVFP
ncbi:hypothetical protein L1987_20167 [Smallanthus sonchifolius]|uniref:Uncharacterized protein n=1 Tax=Smallanthus sonchifolius TaxID=185202 RepID=A0ACB9IQK8_9ASTR|nr:hypothetical protein L1987_20167 [Smallanthus sonchifolius]